MEALIKLLLVTFLILLQFSDVQLNDESALKCFFPGKSTRRIYDQINEHLRSNKVSDVDWNQSNQLNPSSEAESGLTNAINWLQSKGSEGSCFGSSSLKALKQLTDLKRINENTICDEESYKIIKKNLHSTRHRAFFSSERSIDRIVRHHLERHASDCVLVYLRQFRTISQKLAHEEWLGRVREFVAGYVNGKIRYLTGKSNAIDWIPGSNSDIMRKELEDWVEFDADKLVFIDAQLRPEALQAALKHLSMGTEEEKYLDGYRSKKSGRVLVRIDKVDNLFKRLIVKPCKLYNEAFNSDLMKYANFEFSQLRKGLKSKAHILLSLEFTIGQIAAQLCHQVKSERFSLLASLDKYLLKHPKEESGSLQ